MRSSAQSRCRNLPARSACVRLWRSATSITAREVTRRQPRWLTRAEGEPLVADYALYWHAETDLALGHSADALAELKRFRSEYPDSVMTDAALQSLGDAALAANQPAEAVAALDAYSQTTQRPALLLLRGEAREQAGKPLDAVADYQAVYMRFATSEQARQAGTKLGFLRSSLGADFPPLALDQRLTHAAMQFGAKNWNDARNEYAAIMPELSGADRERAQLRILEIGVALGAGPSEMAALQITDPDVDAERLESLAEYYRAQQQEPQMVAAIEGVLSRAPSSHWAESALFLAGNYYWVQLDRDRAASYYKRLEENFPTSSNATSAQWRVAWSAVLKRQPEAAKTVAGSPAAISGISVHAGRAVLARSPCRGSGNSSAGARLLREIGAALSAGADDRAGSRQPGAGDRGVPDAATPEHRDGVAATSRHPY